jgi:phosphoesterase RecJ-like protein
MNTQTSSNTARPAWHTPELEQAAACLAQVNRPAVVGHNTPDADCLASQFAVALALAERGARPCAVIPSQSISQRLEFLLEMADGIQIVEDLPDDADWVLVVDTAMARRVNLPEKDAKLAGKRIFNLDHHATNDDFGEVNYVDAKASSSSELVWRVFGVMGVPISPQIASLLYTGLFGDTEGFTLPNTTESSLHTAADLVSRGARVPYIGEQMARSKTQHEFDLLRTVYRNTRVIADGRIAYSTVTHDDLVLAGCSAQDIDDQVGVPRSLRGVQMALLFSEGVPGVVRVNFRGEGDLSVLPLAKSLNGGGHHQAAGTKLPGEFAPTVDRVLEAAVCYLDNPASFDA